MKTFLSTLCLTIAMIFGGAGGSSGDDTVTTQKSDAISKILNKLDLIEKRLSSVEKRISPDNVFQRLADAFPQTGSKNKKKSNNAELKSDGFLKITDWYARPAESSNYDIQKYIFVSYTLKNISKRDIVLVNGATVFQDKLGENIARLKLPSDLDIPAGSSLREEGRYSITLSFSRNALNRLITVKKNLVDVTVDLDKIMFSDGTKINFDK